MLRPVLYCPESLCVIKGDTGLPVFTTLVKLQLLEAKGSRFFTRWYPAFICKRTGDDNKRIAGILFKIESQL